MDFFRVGLYSLNDVRRDFDNNGVTKELDEMDKFIIECRRKKSIIGSDITSNSKLNLTIDKIRSELSRLRPLGRKQHCVFCRKNGEQYQVYSTHIIRNDGGEVICPILQKYKCPMCGATGKRAHTMKYCQSSDGIANFSADSSVCVGSVELPHQSSVTGGRQHF